MPGYIIPVTVILSLSSGRYLSQEFKIHMGLRFSAWGLRFSPKDLRFSPRGLHFSPRGLRFSPEGLRSSFLGLRFRNTPLRCTVAFYDDGKENFVALKCVVVRPCNNHQTPSYAYPGSQRLFMRGFRFRSTLKK